MSSRVIDRLERWSSRRQLRVRGHNPATLALHSARRFIDVRVTGLAAEMTYYALLSTVPLLTALGAGLGALEGILGAERIAELERTLISSIESVLSADLTEDIAAPLVEELLTQQRTGVAVGGLAISLWLAGRMFRAAIRALDDTYDVDERRTLLQQWGLSMGFLLGALVLVVVMLSMLVVGPLLGGGQQLAEWLGLGGAAELFWTFGRWPLIGAVGVLFLVVLYRVGPNVTNTWRDCLPGAVLATIGLVLVTVGFRTYIELAGPQAPEVGDADEAVRIAAQLIGVVLATLLLVWLSNISILVGGVFNAELRRSRAAALDHGSASLEDDGTAPGSARRDTSSSDEESAAT